MINSLLPYQIFVFGSNVYGNHAGGAARQALEQFGAVNGLGVGPQGQSYAIPTLGWNMGRLPIQYIQLYVDQFVEYAKEMPHKEFLVTPIGTGIAGFSVEDMASLWDREIPKNIFLPEEFTDLL